jgi:parallel beta-helix repeat protein
MHGSHTLRFFTLICLLFGLLTASVAVGAQETTPEAVVTEEAPPQEEPVVTEAPTEEPIVTEAPTEEPVVTEVPTEEPVVTEAPTEEPVVTEVPTEAPALSAPPVFNLSASSFEATVGVPLDISLSVSDDLGVVRVAADASATLGGVSVVTSDPVESAAPFNTGVVVTYLAPADTVGVDSFSLSAIDSDGQSVSVSIGVNVVAAQATVDEATEEPVDDVMGPKAYVVNVASDGSDTDLTNNQCDSDAGTNGNQCSLRAAIENANNNVGFTDTITFSIVGSVPAQINPDTSLPTITDPIIIQAMLGKVALNDLAGISIGLRLGAGSNGSRISGLVITSFDNVGILVNSNANVISGNYIGVEADGVTPAGNEVVGILLEDAASNIIGGAAAAARNIISGNGTGIFISGGAGGHIISGNYIGVDKTGKAAIDNSEDGIYIGNSDENTVGGDSAGERNIISGNGGSGVEISDSNGNVVSGNYIGVDLTGKIGIANGADGVTLGNGSDGNTVGGDVVGESNVISNNELSGVAIVSSANNTISGNLIGTDSTGSSALGNGTGIRLNNAVDNIIGGDTPGERNVISDNIISGVLLENDSNSNDIQGNYIGVTKAGNRALGNNTGGVVISASNNNTIGGAAANLRNVISGNKDHNIVLSGGSVNTLIQNNYIGTDQTGKKAPIGSDLASNGIQIVSAGGVGIGGATAQANVISFNNVGVNVLTGTGIVISSNSIVNNISLGIDLVGEGVTANDSGDGDSGPNALLNFPVITEATATTVSGTLSTAAGQAIRIEVFSNPTCDTTGFGEGAVFLGSFDIGATTGGADAFTVTLATPLRPGAILTATATNIVNFPDPFLNGTSEFSRCFAFASAAPTAKAKLIFPANNSTIFSTAATFEWGAAAQADDYRIQVSTTTGANFTSGIFIDDDVDGALEHFDFLLGDNVYYWRVIACNINGCGTPSMPAKFTVNTTTGPILSRPLNFGFTGDTTPTFSWLRLAGAVEYTVFWTQDESFGVDCDDLAFYDYDATVKTTSFTINPANPSLFVDPLLEGRVYWCVVAEDAAGNESEGSEVRIFDVTLLKTPLFGGVVADTTPTFSWNRVPGVGVTYNLQVDNDFDFLSPNLDKSELTGVSYTPTAAEALPVGQTYFWRIIVDGGDWEVYDSPVVWGFVVVNARPIAPVITTPQSPANGATNVSVSNVTLDWNAVAAVPGATIDYEIWIDTNPGFTNLITRNAGAADVYDLDANFTLQPATRYYWKVRALYNGLPGPFSSTRNFLTAP